MSMIEKATRRLEQLERAGVTVPWSAAKSSSALVGARKGGSEHLPAAVAALHVAAQAEAAPASPAQAEVSVARPALRNAVTLDLDRLRDRGYLVPDQVRSEMAQQFRRLKGPLLKNARAHLDLPDQRGALIMVTSAMPGEGKTFCALNLAMSMAMEVDTAVALIDADVLRPNVFDRLGVREKPPGLLDLLTRDDLDLQDTLIATNVAKLSIMTAGERNDRSTELLASTAMDRVLTRLATEYADHVVIFDAPPLLLTTESSVLASKVGQVVVVVESSKTPRNSLRHAYQALRNCPIVLSVLNKCDEPSDTERYGYYY